ncbi:MAG: family 20 glycosylhydrolase, partial [Chitinispirillaceae bacterium]|nr:family 20 glycosylhydrolase [Chitinispirillaceae bacterium]
LDNYCKEKHIELIPCLATFGHLYELLRLPRFEHLNELDIKASTFPHSLWDRMAHYTIDPLNEESFSLVRSMIEEYASLFSSKYFNLCCDETFDLGKGKNRKIAEKAGVGKLYVDFVKKLCNVVIENGKIPMIWGDIVLKYPEIVSEIPEGTIFLNWNYNPSPSEDNVRFFYEKGVPQYVCPGVWGWSRFVNEINKATDNIRRQIEFGKKYSVGGVLITDWGDCGHVNFFTASLHGLALGASLSWNLESIENNNAFDIRLSEYEWGKAASFLYSNLRELGSLCNYHFGNIYAWINNKECLWNIEKEVAKWEIENLSLNYKRASEILNYLKQLYEHLLPQKKEDFEEILWGARAVRWTLALLVVKVIVEYGKKGDFIVSTLNLIEETKMLKDNFVYLWLRKNKRSELENVVAVFDRVGEWLSTFCLR